MPNLKRRSIADEFVGLIHAFGVLKTDSTPCGQPMSVSTAHAICELVTNGPVNQGELATKIGLTTSTISRLVDKLERRGWATRRSDPATTDQRVRLVQLTSAGEAVAQQVLDARADRFDRLLLSIDATKHEQVVESLHLLREAVDELH